jgi:hypothetical protein
MSAPLFLQAAAAGNTGGVISYGSNVTKGDFLLCIAQMNSSTHPATGVTDTVGSNWQQLLSGLMNLGGGSFISVSVWYATAAASGANTVTIAPNGGSFHANTESIAEYSPAAIDVFSAFLTGDGSTSVNPLVGNAVTTNKAIETLVGWASNLSGGLTGSVGGGYTADVTSGGFQLYNNTEHQSVSSVGSYSANFGNSGGQWSCGVIGLYNPADYPASAWSPVDSRVAVSGFGPGPNQPIGVQGAEIYTGQTSSNPAVPGKDSRVNKPVDCRVSPNIPENSRTFPPFKS